MSEMRKITVEVPADLLERVQQFVGEGVSGTVRAGLTQLDNLRAQQEMRSLRGTFKFSMDLDTLREDRTFKSRRK